MDEKLLHELIDGAIKAKANSYSPYSNYRVGAALLARSGKIYVGCNIENSAYPVTVCAERTAFFTAIAAGEREFVAVALSGSSEHCLPCGSCRQVMSEFCGEDFKIISADSPDVWYEHTLGELLPYSFKLN